MKCGYRSSRWLERWESSGREATERVYVGGKDIKREEDVPHSAAMDEEKGRA